jgi:hypothetical protein
MEISLTYLFYVVLAAAVLLRLISPGKKPAYPAHQS